MSATDIDQDRQLVARLIAGEQTAFRQFFDDYFARLFRFCIRRLDGDEDATRDVVQVTMTKAVQNLHSWRGDATLYTWLCQIGRHSIADHIRARRRYDDRIVSTDASKAVRATVEDLPAPESHSPAGQHGRQEISRVIQQLLDNLPARYGDALEWKYVEGLSVEEIAARLGVGTTAAQSVLARARDAFRKRLNVMSADDRFVIEHLL